MEHTKRVLHYIAFTLSVLAAIGGGLLIPHVNVNSDMTKYLPDDSQMKQGLDIMSAEFTAAQLQSADVKVMFQALSAEQRDELVDSLKQINDVQDVTFELSEDSTYTLFNLIVPKSVDQKTLGANIREQYADYQDNVIVETSQDGATPPFFVIVIAAVLIGFVLFAMSQSWLDPVIILLSAGIAVVLNVGSNAFFPSVSITTNYIVGILQLVLSLDYSIILINRYRQEMETGSNKYLSINNALKRATRPILSSALTTVVGLLMLLFMRLKIGTDMGLVLAKGVICSLICTFTVMPTLLLACTKVMRKTSKRTFVIPTDRLGRFATHHKVSLAISSVVLFVAAFYLSRQTEISFSTNGESRIAKIFPKTNPVLIIYDVENEMNVIDLADSISYMPGVTNLISYPTLLKKQYTAEGLTDYIKELTTAMEDYLPDVEGLDMLTPELMQVVYYTHCGASDTLQIGFKDLMMCVRQDCMDNPFFSNVIDQRMRDQIQLLDMLMAPPAEEEEDTIEEPVETAKPIQRSIVTEPIQPVTITTPTNDSSHKPIIVTIPTMTAEESERNSTISSDTVILPNDKIDLHTFLGKLARNVGDETAIELHRLTDASMLNKELNVRQMADFIGSTNAQTKMVYSFAGEGKRMTPMSYVHFLTDDLFKRKALANMVSSDQKQQLTLRKDLMDLVLTNPLMTPAELVTTLQPFGIHYLSEEQVKEIAFERPKTTPTQVPQPAVTEVVLAENTETPAQEEVQEPTPVVEVAPVVVPTPQKPIVKRQSKAERQAELMDKLLHSDKKYTAEEMHRNFAQLGEQMDLNTVKKLYSFYGSLYAYIDSLTMSTEQMLRYVGDTLAHDSTVIQFLGEENTARIQSIPSLVGENIGMLSNNRHGLFIVLTSFPDESEQTYQFVDTLRTLADQCLDKPHYLIGESVMFDEMKLGFSDEMTRITWLTILAIFLIVAISFKSLIVPIILVMTVMTAVFVNVIFSGLISGQMLYLAYLIVQSILMGATIDYGILYTNYYKEYRKTMEQYTAATEAYHGAIRTITTSGLIMVLGPGVMALCIEDVAISAIVGCLAIGAAVSILLILVVLPGVLIAFDKLVVHGGFTRK
ncbi:MAG: efflux RND transporter permease subunit [Paludibacteraceae bacterium]|nr:efflux RND transporter permease subunit [Paludibacteraceae bacterium]